MLRSPAVHFALVGGLLFAGGRFLTGSEHQPVTRLEVPASRVEAVRDELVFELGRTRGRRRRNGRRAGHGPGRPLARVV